MEHSKIMENMPYLISECTRKLLFMIERHIYISGLLIQLKYAILSH